MPFRWRAMLVIGIAALPLFVLALYFAQERRNEELKRAGVLAAAMARTLADEQSRIFVHARQLVAALAVGNDEASDTLLGPECDAEASRLVRANPAYYQIGVTDPDGRLRCSALEELKDADLRERDFFHAARTTDDVVLSG